MRYQLAKLCLWISNHILPLNIQNRQICIFSTMPRESNVFNMLDHEKNKYSSVIFLTSSSAFVLLPCKGGRSLEYIQLAANLQQLYEWENLNPGDVKLY